MTDTARMLTQIFNLMSAFVSPCEIVVSEPTTFFTDGIDLLDASGSDVLGCTLYADDPTDVLIETSSQAIVVGPQWWSELASGESTSLPSFGDYSIGVPAGLEGNQTNGTTFCCTTVCAPFVGCVTVCYQGCGGVDKVVHTKERPENSL